MSNKWVEHVKQYSKSHNIKYNECLKNKDCKESYKSSKNQDGKGVLSNVVDVGKKVVKKAAKKVVKNKLNDIVDMGTTKLNKMGKDKIE